MQLSGTSLSVVTHENADALRGYLGAAGFQGDDTDALLV
eukprot:COSAG06_NODE_4917_length_3859_cov_2.785638_1_plen_38_part_10